MNTHKNDNKTLERLKTLTSNSLHTGSWNCKKTTDGSVQQGKTAIAVTSATVSVITLSKHRKPCVIYGIGFQVQFFYFFSVKKLL